jgi:hypothetical protein
VPWFAGIVAASFTAVCLAGLVRVRASAVTA